MRSRLNDASCNDSSKEPRLILYSRNDTDRLVARDSKFNTVIKDFNRVGNVMLIIREDKKSTCIEIYSSAVDIYEE